MIPEDLKKLYDFLVDRAHEDGGSGEWSCDDDAETAHLIERIGRVEEENLVLRGRDQTVYFHGTKRENVEKIQREGFAEGTYFARNMEDAVKFGGPCVFVVNVHFETPSLDGWQVVCANSIPAKFIIELRYVSARDFEAENAKLKAQVKRLSAPVSNEEILAHMVDGEDGCDIAALIADRVKESEDHHA